jgi:hypothetical protein
MGRIWANDNEMTNFDTLFIDRAQVIDRPRLRSALVANSPAGMATLRDIGNPRFGGGVAHARVPGDYYRPICIEYWCAALCAGTLAWAALLAQL